MHNTYLTKHHTAVVIIAALSLLTLSPLTRADEANDIALRGDLSNARIRFEREHKGHVAFMGGSITEMNGYRPMVMDLLRKRFPETAFTFTDAGIASTCSTTGAFRLDADVLSKGPVDMFFVEFAVNDDQDAAHTRTECIRGMEGIIRHLRRHNPMAEIVIVYFVNEHMRDMLAKGEVPLPIQAHEDVAKHYGVSTIHLAHTVAMRIKAGELTWQQYGGTHPAKFGNAIAADMIDKLLDRAWAKPLTDDTKPGPHKLPEPMDPYNYENGRFINPNQASAAAGWKVYVPDWKSIKGSFRDRFANLPMLVSEEPGSDVTLRFTGKAIGAYVLAGPDAGMIEARIDGGKPVTVDLFHRFSKGLHYPRTVMFATDLDAGEHVLTFHIINQHNPASTGTAVRIVQFVAN